MFFFFFCGTKIIFVFKFRLVLKRFLILLPIVVVAVLRKFCYVLKTKFLYNFFFDFVLFSKGTFELFLFLQIKLSIGMIDFSLN